MTRAAHPQLVALRKIASAAGKPETLPKAAGPWPGKAKGSSAPVPDLIAALLATSPAVPPGLGMWNGRTVRELCAAPAMSMFGRPPMVPPPGSAALEGLNRSQVGASLQFCHEDRRRSHSVTRTRSRHDGHGRSITRRGAAVTAEHCDNTKDSFCI